MNLWLDRYERYVLPTELKAFWKLIGNIRIIHIIIIFRVIKEGSKYDISIEEKIKLKIKNYCSPKHVPSFVIPVKEIPYTMNGKKIELAVKKIIEGKTISNKDSIANPDSLYFFESFKIG